MKKLIFYICPHCKNVVIKLHDAGVPLVCCGKVMDELVANTTDGATEKHVPQVHIEGNKVEVQVGSVLHPSLQEHHIEFIVVETENGFSVHYLNPTDVPQASFLVNEKVIAVYEYCNLHGLWKTLV
ncbi:MAG: desulfoferrodoxin family protein [Erysipelotrichaceae bacterium]